MMEYQTDGKLQPKSSKNIDIVRGIGATDDFEGTFRRAIWPFLAIGQMFGVMPVVGVSSRFVSELRFEWKSYRTIYAVIIAIIFAVYISFLFPRLFVDITFSIFPFLFYFINTLVIISFLVLSLHWPALMRQWQNVESLPIFQNFVHKTAYKWRIRLIITTGLLLALVECLIYIIVSIKYEKFIWITSQREPNLNYKAIIIVCCLNVNAAFVWNFIDIFLMSVAIGLTTHFKVLNNELERVKLGMEYLPPDYWMKMRTQFTKLCELVAMVDEKISHLILLSFLNNLFTICQQLFDSLRPWPTYFYVTYFWYCFLFLIIRAFTVSFLVARIDDEARKPIAILRTIPSYLWNEETKRFFDDILSQRVALSGMGFFFITRQFILSVTGTIVTYELVLMQFNRD